MPRPATHDRRSSTRRRFLTLAGAALAAAIVGGCTPRGQREAVANAAATIYEAAVAIGRGVPPAQAVEVIKANAVAIAACQGYRYPPPPATPVPEHKP